MLLKSDTKITVEAPQVIVNCETAEVNASSSVKVDTPDTEVTGNLKVGGDVEFNGSSVTHNGKNIGQLHTHLGVETGSGTSGPPA